MLAAPTPIFIGMDSRSRRLRLADLVADHPDLRLVGHAPVDHSCLRATIARRPDEYPWMRPMGDAPGYRGLNGGQATQYFAPIRPGDVITAEVTLVDAHEKEGKGGTMLFLIDEARWTNQLGELVRIGRRTSIYR